MIYVKEQSAIVEAEREATKLHAGRVEKCLIIRNVEQLFKDKL